ncbi:holin, partial [Salmonella enterica]|nr:holin [Salmonella enterica]EBM9045935.1 holin [Salmonella enterica subsp. enterica serovar Schwarzengrund]EBR9771008.1 holin [Salmonella enterica subsp. enterica serovar Give]ECE0102652.1 holin [Salmonella enterica subsp. enterica serovar 4,12:d:-]ECK9414332.1 holin [Salmonella enterica subsp. enterica serovar Typhisuis str. CFSAN000655]ECY3287568.1 holin [Salmonella enterica subsp. enterica serovar Stanley]ECY4356527.1 holin [Salmonella enterica subsp. enterica serovar Mbandaka]EEC085216
MQDYEKGFIALAIMGALIALGKMLNSDEPITARLVLGRVIVGSALSVAAGVALYFVPDIHPLALAGIGSALGILGLNGVEAWLRK